MLKNIKNCPTSWQTFSHSSCCGHLLSSSLTSLKFGHSLLWDLIHVECMCEISCSCSSPVTNSFWPHQPDLVKCLLLFLYPLWSSRCPEALVPDQLKCSSLATFSASLLSSAENSCMGQSTPPNPNPNPNRGVAEKSVRMVQDMYEDSETVVRCSVGVTEGSRWGQEYIRDRFRESLHVCSGDVKVDR